MCGIGGIYRQTKAQFDMVGVLRKMVSIQHHRGPDASGIWVNPTNTVGLCHNRLSILDLSPAGNQPMHSVDHQLEIVFNGEIYNWLELRNELLNTGVAFRTQTDTEVLLEAYRAYGTDVLPKLRGMFAFAIYDARDGSLFCARDRVGKKPFVYAETVNGFAFASEIPAVRQMPGCDIALNQAAIAGMLLHNMRHITDPATAYRGLTRLRAGHAMLVRHGRVARLWRYWTPAAADGAITPTALRELLEEAVRLRLAADVPVGALLSGGVDSSAIVNLMCQISGERIRTYALGLDCQDEDLIRARRMAAELGTLHTEYYFDAEEQLSIFDKLLASYGEPIMLLPLIHTYQLSRAIRDDGVKVVLSGHGADELFYGYTGHLRTARLSKYLDRLKGLCAITRFLPDKFKKGPLCLLAAHAGMRKAAYYRWQENECWGNLLTAEARQHVGNIVADEMEYWGQLSPSKRYIDESNFVGLMVENTHSVITATDLAPMMASVEMRAPFLDQDVVSFALATPVEQKVPRDGDVSMLKFILKQAVSDLVPHDLLYASKRGFGMGIQEKYVFSGPWRRRAMQVFEEPHDVGKMFDPAAIRGLWRSFLEGRAPASTIARLFAIQTWAQTAL